ncbi:MAG: zinc-dependent metalloprotease, partial [Betaproteobacteria bacterium]|nr:zinc-dependent metalloprotease [Betaproteobacteria bacterium]
AVRPPARPPFAEVIREARRLPGLFTVWQKDEKVWLEIAPAQFDKPFLLATTRVSGLGERGFYPHWMLGRHVVAWRRVHGSVQLIARATRFGSSADAGLARAAGLSFSDSLLGSAPLASAEHPERGSVLVELSPILLSDLPQLTRQLESSFRVSYSFDARNSHIGPVSADARELVFPVTAHYALPRLPAPPAGPVPPGTPVPSAPRNLEDPRSLFVDYRYSLSALPEPVMRPRAADPRVGHYVQQNYDWTESGARDARRNVVTRWRIEPRDPSAALSEPVRPVVFWLDRNIPARLRPAITAGVLEWNKAFERIGIRDALQVREEPADAPMDLTSVQHASIRWFLDSDDGALAIGPSLTDPRSGEIIDADIAISDNWARFGRRLVRESLPGSRFAETGAAHAHGPGCQHAAESLAELDFALALLESRGDLDPEGPEAERIVADLIKDLVMHEVGHTLGLRHNFRASLAVPVARLADPAFTRANGLSGSVMDYNGFNLPLAGEPVGPITMTTLGPYDYWAIEYAYRPLPPEREAAELARIASRANEPALAYGTDEEVVAGYDPQVNQRDLGDDPLAWATRRLALSRELWARLQTRTLPPGTGFGVLRRGFDSGLRQIDLAAEVAAKHVGGVNYFRDVSGDARPAFVPVPGSRQREALSLLAREVLAEDSLAIAPSLVARLSTDPLDRGAWPPPLPAVLQSVASLQRRLLDRLLGDAVLTRLQENEATLAPAERLPLPELFDTLRESIWRELARGADIGVARRMLQREHLRKLTGLLMRPGSAVPPDARALARVDARRLSARIEAALRSRQLSREARAHLEESLASLRDALRAGLTRAAG